MSNRARRQSAAVRKEEILRTAVAEIERRGFEGLRVADVAAALGVSPALVFYHFANKDQLLAGALAYAAERDLGRLTKARDSCGSALECLRAVLHLYSPTGSTAYSWQLWIDAWAAALREPALRKVSRRLDLVWKDAVAAVIADGVASGEFRCDDPHAAAWRITALLDGLAIQVTVHRGVITRRQMDALVRRQAERELDLSDGALS